MDSRRPIRPTSTARRGLFHNNISRRHPNLLHNASSLHPSHTTSSSSSARSTIPIATEEHDPAEDIVERDSAGNYKISAPITATKMGGGGMTKEDEKIEQENHMIALYGKESSHWDHAAIQADIMEALQSSLERKVQTLEVDRWMFEGEGKGRG